MGYLLAIYSIQPQAVAAIPLNAFASEAEVDVFLQTLAMFQAMAKHRQQVQHQPMVTVISDNPYQAPSTMYGRSTAEIPLARQLLDFALTFNYS